MAIKVKREEITLEEELAEKLKEFGLEIQLPEDDKETQETDDEQSLVFFLTFCIIYFTLQLRRIAWVFNLVGSLFI